MKRCWIGFFFLLVLLGISIAVTWAMVKIHDPIEADLNQAAECALLGDWDNAADFFHRGQEKWKQWAHFRACFADHTPVEDIDSSFQLLQFYCLSRENAAFAAETSRLAKQIAAVGEAHEFVWWNVF